MSGLYTPGLPAPSNILTGNETLALDTNLSSGVYPETYAPTVNQLGQAMRTMGQPIANFRNLIDGGDFTVNPFQRGTSFTSITNSATYTADRFFAIGGASSSISVSKQTITDNASFGSALQWGRASSNGNTATIKLGQVLESADSIRAQGQQVLLSFYAKAGANWSGTSLTAQVSTGTGSDDSAANLNSGTWAGEVDTTGSFVPTTSWQRFYLLATVGATAKQLGILFSYAPVGTAGANDWIQFSGIQMEIVSSVPTTATQAALANIASPFEHRDVQVELEICQRYFYQLAEPASGVVMGAGMISATNAQTVLINLPVQMRSAPTVAVTAGSMTFNIAGTPTAVGGGFAAGSTHTVNGISVVGTVTATVGQATLLLGGGGVGKITASAEY